MDALKITVEVESDTVEPTPEPRTHYVGITQVTGWGVFRLDADDIDGVLSDLDADGVGYFEAAHAKGLPAHNCGDVVRLGIRWELVIFSLTEWFALGAIQGFDAGNGYDESYAKTAVIDSGVAEDLVWARIWLDAYRAAEPEKT